MPQAFRLADLWQTQLWKFEDEGLLNCCKVLYMTHKEGVSQSGDVIFNVLHWFWAVVRRALCGVLVKPVQLDQRDSMRLLLHLASLAAYAAAFQVRVPLCSHPQSQYLGAGSRRWEQARRAHREGSISIPQKQYHLRHRPVDDGVGQRTWSNLMSHRYSGTSLLPRSTLSREYSWDLSLAVGV